MNLCVMPHFYRSVALLFFSYLCGFCRCFLPLFCTEKVFARAMSAAFARSDLLLVRFLHKNQKVIKVRG